jgi:hypothetical protein
MRIGLVASAATLSLVGLLVAVPYLHADQGGDPGPYSAFTRHELQTFWPATDRYPLFVPVELPQDATGIEGGPFLANVTTDPHGSPAQRSWVSYYDVDIDGVLDSSYRVFQRPAGDGDDHPCGPMGDIPHVERAIRQATLTICSPDLADDPQAREYWSNVSFTGRVDSVGWLQD